MILLRVFFLTAAAIPLASHALIAQVAEDTLTRQLPFVRGGVYDKPFVGRLFGQTSLGGYMEAVWKLERESGLTEELTFEARRFNIFLHSVISERARIFAELEFEHGTEEIALEFASLDFEIHHLLIFRGGIILSPLGKFNLTHDSPLNELTDRPLVSTQIIPTALSEAGMGFYGAFYPSAASRISYEAYAVNGFTGGIISTGSGTRIRGGRGELGEDNNKVPSFVGRAAYSPSQGIEIGASVHTGIYNAYELDEFTIDEKRALTITAVDWELSAGRFDLIGEAAAASIDIQPSLRGLFAQRQQGVYVQGNIRFAEGWLASLQASRFTGVVRFDYVDFDADIDGDAEQRLSVGLNVRPTSDTAFKLDYHRDWFWSRVDVEAEGAGINFSVASYF